MAKYKRKGEIVEAEWHPSGLMLPDGPGRVVSPCYTTKNPDGSLFIWDKDAFDREYERVEEKESVSEYFWRCADCGTRVGFTWPATVQCTECQRKAEAPKKPKPADRVFCADCGCDCGEWDELPGYYREIGLVCNACHRKREPAKKPTPLTVADLQPGEVFVWGDSPRQTYGPKQVLGGNRYYSQDDHRVYDVTFRDTAVSVVAHHTLTPKQLLWIDASEEERKALDDSIRDKWLPITRKERTGRCEVDCPLCALAKHVCARCLIYRSTRAWRCGSTPWSREAEYGDYPKARAFTLWLAEFLPQIHPLRIEVEATPVEWAAPSKAEGPGKK